MYRIPKEIQSSTMIGRKITLADILFGGAWLGSTWGFGRLFVHSFYTIPYYVFSILVMLHLLSPVKESAKVKRFESYIFYLLRKRGARHAVLIEESGED